MRISRCIALAVLANLMVVSFVAFGKQKPSCTIFIQPDGGLEVKEMRRGAQATPSPQAKPGDSEGTTENEKKADPLLAGVTVAGDRSGFRT